MSDQPAPTRSISTPIVKLVIADPAEADRPVASLVKSDLLGRAELGRERYGVYLQAGNGRDAR